MPTFDRFFLSAFDFEKIELWRGSREKHALDAALVSLDNLENSAHSKNSVDAKNCLTNFFANKIPQVTNEETPADILCARSLTSLAKTKSQPWVDENDESKKFEEAQWSFSETVELNRQFEQKFEPALQTFFDYLISGRTFSGRSIAKGAGLYAYLTKAEIDEMSILLTRHYEEAFNLLDCGAFCKVDFESSMIEIMETMLFTLKQASEHDLFIIAS
jgi:hypothetical protein